MFSNDSLWLTILFFVVAVTYAAVGQAGASGYLAAMGVFGIAPEVMKPTALALNLLVAGIGTIQFWRMGLLSWRTFYPFAVLGIPFSLLGGALHLPAAVYYPVVGVILVLAGIQMLRLAKRKAGEQTAPPASPPFLPALLTGAVIGVISGATGTGGGIFLAPIILAMNWVDVRRTAAVTIVYNLLNSAAALVGTYATLKTLPAHLPYWLLAVGLGGLLGSVVGSRYLPDKALRLILAIILLMAGIKLVIG